MKRIERELQTTLATILTERIKARNLTEKLSAYPAAEESRADITIKSSKGKALYFIELKDPKAPDGRTAGNAEVYKRESKRAAKMGVSYFSVCNFIEAVFYDLDAGDEALLQAGNAFQIEDIDRLRTSYHLTQSLEAKFNLVADWHINCALSILGENTIAKTTIDEAFIYKIKRFIEVSVYGVSDSLWEQFQKSRAFKRELEVYAQKQEWQIPTTEFELRDYAYIALLMLISKLMVYKAFVDFKEWKVPPLLEPKPDENAKHYFGYLWENIEQLKEITGDFELLFGQKMDILNVIPFLSESSLDLVRDVLGIEERYNFANLSYDIVGRIFEGLIREDERHKRGQYFTSSRIVDLINAFCIRTGKERIIDPSCGSGTFLVRAYQRKKDIAGQPHKTLLNEITGIDISGYATHLAMLNLAMRDLRLQCYPRIIQRDFFRIGWQRSISVKDLGGKEKRITFDDFDAVIGNPPYTRQEDINAFDANAKDNILKVIQQEWRLEPPSNTSIYAHFFYHAGKMLKNQGYLGFIVQNSWLDTRYGETLQQWMTQHFRIVAIIDTKVERFFTSAEVNTNIVILQREENSELRQNHIAKFVYLKKHLAQLYEHLTDATSLQPHNADDKPSPDVLMRDAIESCTEDYTDEFWTIRLVPQSQLISANNSVSVAWSAYLRAPDVYWRILARGADRWKPLKSIADVQRGYTTGANEFFFVHDVTMQMQQEDFGAIRNHPSKRIRTLQQVLDAGLRVVKTEINELWLIEQEYLAPAVKSPQELSSYHVAETAFSRRLIMCHETKAVLKKTAPYLWKYIQRGEQLGFHERPTCASRGETWWDLGEREKPDMSFNYMIHEIGKTYLMKTYVGDNLQSIKAQTHSDIKSLWFYLNSTWSWLMQNVMIRTNFGGGVAKIQTYELESLPCILPKVQYIPILENVQSIFDELGALDGVFVGLERVSSVRKSLDRAVLSAIGFRDEEIDDVLAELYTAVIDLVSSRLDKAHSVDSEKKRKQTVEIGVLVEELEVRLLEENIVVERTANFSRQLQNIATRITPKVKEQNDIIKAFWKKRFDEQYNYQRLIDEQQLGFFSE